MSGFRGAVRSAMVDGLTYSANRRDPWPTTTRSSPGRSAPTGHARGRRRLWFPLCRRPPHGHAVLTRHADSCVRAVALKRGERDEQELVGAAALVRRVGRAMP